MKVTNTQKTPEMFHTSSSRNLKIIRGSENFLIQGPYNDIIQLNPGDEPIYVGGSLFIRNDRFRWVKPLASWALQALDHYKTVLKQFPPVLKEVLFYVLSEYPELAQVPITIEVDPDDNRARYIPPDGGQDNIFGSIDLSLGIGNDPRFYTHIAALYGLKGEDFISMPELLYLHNLLHELGHALDLIRGSNGRDPHIFAQMTAVRRYEERESDAILSLSYEFSELLRLGKKSEIDSFILKQMSKHGVSMPIEEWKKDFIFVTQERYRRIPEEARADAFSVYMVRKLFNIFVEKGKLNCQFKDDPLPLQGNRYRIYRPGTNSDAQQYEAITLHQEIIEGEILEVKKDEALLQFGEVLSIFYVQGVWHITVENDKIREDLILTEEDT